MAELPHSFERRNTDWVTAALAERCGQNPDSVQMADATIAVWYDINIALKSIIGQQGVAALYDRSIVLTARAHAWLGSSRAAQDHVVDLDGLQSIIAQQSNEEAAKGAILFLQTFYDVLVSLIGAALTEQLLTSTREYRA